MVIWGVDEVFERENCEKNTKTKHKRETTYEEVNFGSFGTG
jgi:hypothetical protein